MSEEIAVLANEITHMKNAVNELKDEIKELRTCVNKMKVSHAKILGYLAAVGTAGGAVGAGAFKLLFSG